MCYVHYLFAHRRFLPAVILILSSVSCTTSGLAMQGLRKASLHGQQCSVGVLKLTGVTAGQLSCSTKHQLSGHDTAGCTQPRMLATRGNCGENMYEDACDKACLLQGLSFRVPAGTSTALVGASGSGKSTVLRLLFRSFDAAAGNITVNGLDTRNIELASLRSAIAVVPQACSGRLLLSPSLP